MPSIFKFGFAALLPAGFLLISPPAFADDPIFVCAAKDTGVMRMVKAARDCKATETSMKLAAWEAEEAEAPEDDATEKQIAALEKKVAALESQLDKRIQQKVDVAVKAAAKPEPASSTTKVTSSQRVTAPFEVVDKSGKVILRVAERVDSRKANAAVTIGYGTAGNMAVRVHNKAGDFVAGMGQAGGTTQSGSVAVMNDKSQSAAVLSGMLHGLFLYGSNPDTPSIGLYGGSPGQEDPLVALYGKSGGLPVAFMTLGKDRGGNITMARPDGFGVFSAGSAGDGGGEACLNRVTGGGKERNVCLGVELPSMGLGK